MSSLTNITFGPKSNKIANYLHVNIILNSGPKMVRFSLKNRDALYTVPVHYKKMHELIGNISRDASVTLTAKTSQNRWVSKLIQGLVCKNNHLLFSFACSTMLHTPVHIDKDILHLEHSK